MSISFDKKCDKNKDCKSNVCEMIYNNKEPIGRFCLQDEDEYTKKCKFPKDCNSGICKKILDHNGHFITKKCVKAPKIDKSGSYNALFGSSRTENRYGVLKNTAIQNMVQSNCTDGECPVSEVIIMVLSVIGDIFSILVYDVRKSPSDEDQGMLYSIWKTIFDSVFGGFTKGHNEGLIWGGIQKDHYDKKTRKCVRSKGINMWYIRTLITILLPPFGVFMSRGINGIIYIILSCILTLFGYFPGLIYSFAVINSSESELNELYLLKKI
jgi:uncharacterized membrane protein YqaE (UPF0057 family)